MIQEFCATASLHTAFPEIKYGTDASGQEVLLKDDIPVMKEWEKEYIRAWVDAVSPEKDVLEMGFGCGYSATHIQTYHPTSHTIIEYHPVIAKRAREWATQYPCVQIIENAWQHALPQLHVFDCIFFGGDYLLETSQEYLEKHLLHTHGQEALASGDTLVRMVKEKWPLMHALEYKREDVQEFFHLASQIAVTEAELLRFMTELQRTGQISSDLYQWAIDQIAESQTDRPSDLRTLVSQAQLQQLQHSQERLLDFISQCVKAHMSKGSKLSCLLGSASSLFEHPRAFEELIVNPFLSYREIPLQIQPASKEDFSHTALIVVVENI